VSREPALASLVDPFEPLDESAPIGWRDAPGLCPPECRDYHRVWQYLRLLGVITTIRTNTVFLQHAFGELRTAHPRVMVAATADYGMLAQLHHAYGDHSLDVTVVDRCPTAIALNRWYGHRVGRPVHLVVADLLTFETARPFDLVTTHNLLGRFDDEGRRHLLTTWFRALRPGGVVVTTQRVRPNWTTPRYRYTSEETVDLGARVCDAARRAGLVEPTPDELGETARAFARAKETSAIRSTSAVVEAFEAAGFVVDRVDQGAGMSERHADLPSSTAGLDTFRMRIVARRPNP
jgi:SAM-dependent methyltransferase